jgi:hypothetical protein
VLIAVDFDGVISHYTGFKGIGVFEEPVDGVAEALTILRNAGNKILVNTCRKELDDVAQYMNKHNIPYDFLGNNPDNVTKDLSPAKQLADIYVDDRGICFEGNWSIEFIEKILNFKPWGKKEVKVGEFCELAKRGEDYARAVREQRDTQYGGFKVGDLGIKGLYVDIFRKHGRLKSMVWDEYGNPTDEAILDTAIDLANYALTMAGAIMAKRDAKKNV